MVQALVTTGKVLMSIQKELENMKGLRGVEHGIPIL